MADVSQTAADVGIKSAATVSVVQAGEALTQGQPVYNNANKYYKADASAVSTANAGGIALTKADAADDYVVIAIAGDIDVGATLTAGAVYAVSATAGGIAPVSDIASGEYVTTLGVGKSNGTLDLDINASGSAVA